MTASTKPCRSLCTNGSVIQAMTASGTSQTAPQALTNAINTSMKEFVCPSNGNALYQNPQANPPTCAFTNYKAMGASCKQSLAMAANTTGTAPYGSSTIHPDGAVFPGAGNRAAEMLDGPSHTIFIMETIDDAASRWMLGSQCTLTGLPGQGSTPREL